MYLPTKVEDIQEMSTCVLIDERTLQNILEVRFLKRAKSFINLLSDHHQIQQYASNIKWNRKMHIRHDAWKYPPGHPTLNVSIPSCYWPVLNAKIGNLLSCCISTVQRMRFKQCNGAIYSFDWV